MLPYVFPWWMDSSKRGGQVPETPFILAEEGDLTARRERQWAASSVEHAASKHG